MALFKIPIVGEVQQDAGQVGDVVESILTESQFQAIRGPNWVLMDGRDVTGTSLAQITGNNTLPDARGHFLRGKNNGRNDGLENPDGELSPGTAQLDKTRRPRDTNFSTDNPGSHTHTGTYRQSSTPGTTVAAFGFVGNPASTASVPADGAHTHNITGGGDAETRPRNVTVNIFIKVN